MNSILLIVILSALSQSSVSMLVPKEVNDGPCLSWAEVTPHLYSGVNTVPIMRPGDFYMPMASKSAYRIYAEGLLGRPAENQRELDSMQLIMKCGPLFSTIMNTGFPQMENPPQFSQTCLSGALPSIHDLGIFRGSLNVDHIQAVCVGLPATRPDGSMALRPSDALSSTTDSIVWANADSSVLLVYRCPSDGQKDYKVLSRTPTLSDGDIAIIKDKIFQMGFSEKNIAFARYDD